MKSPRSARVALTLKSKTKPFALAFALVGCVVPASDPPVDGATALDGGSVDSATPDGAIPDSGPGRRFRDATATRGFLGRHWAAVYGGSGPGVKTRDDMIEVDWIYASAKNAID